MGDCPVCSGFYRLNQNCTCGAIMEDMGRLENYADPYGPYEEYDYDLFSGRNPREPSICIHLITCPVCRTDERVAINRRELQGGD